ncbi:sugar transporter [Nitzschia inconspicua]|uniref:Sugar transporter n=1 Tax=Nitzschia inconspicua TaxID=303405 RepID=A0A9K3KTD7_9STRA|nr:sugar transporter [Nitzschia inconspicua]
MSPQTPPDEAPSWFVIQLTATASLGGCLFGYDMGAISGALPQLQHSFGLSNSQLGWVVSILFLGGGFGASIGGPICDWMGRKVTIILTDVIFMLGAAWLYFAGSYEQVLVGRFVVGIGVAVSGVADVSYLHECAPSEWRGSIVSVNEACISLGFLLAYVAGFVFNDKEKEEWRVIFGMAGILAAVQLLGMLKLPESPAWLLERGKVEEARKAVQQINSGRIAIPSDNDTINPVLQDERIEQPDATRIPSPVEAPNIVLSEGSIGMVLTNNNRTTTDDPLQDTYQHPKSEIYDGDSIPSLPMRRGCLPSWLRDFGSNLQSAMYTLCRYRRQVYIALFLSVVQQFCGQTIVLNYAPMIFSEAAKKDSEAAAAAGENVEDSDQDPPDWSTVSIGLVKFVVTALVIWRIEYVGRRTLLLAGTTLIALGLIALIIAFGGSSNHVEQEEAEVSSFWNPLTQLKTFHLALPGVLLVVTGYSMSFGPLTWLLTSELFPTEIRGRALGASTIVTYCCAALVTRTFLSAQAVIGPSKVFAVYCIITAFGIIFEYLAIPDTGEKSVEQIDESLGIMYWWRFDAIALSQIDQDVTTNQRQERSNIEMSPTPSLDSLPSII